MADDTIDDRTTKLAKLMQDRLGIRRGSGFAEKVQIAGRLLPRRIRREAQVLIDTAVLTQNPKLRRQINHDQLRKSFAVVETHLKGIDPNERLKGRILTILAIIAFNFLLIAATIITVMVWRGDL
ncbi:hypothetical protein [Actibacterium sp. 188UL27-1]|uniref:hypothetical protein n=1 Tax=Actibacterium sp. 188UL27-1 TaxID=2786961 RepID=UPI00195D5EFF|nr:hypothetical protein [Actibacterium sp. 188UL27-1]MBM7066166.1 hypothetical protein [Actibacterium sp. 188UL27-1]